jgi:hypothetical protein
MEPAQSYSVAPAAVTVNPICSPPHSPRRSADVTEFCTRKEKSNRRKRALKLDECFRRMLGLGKYEGNQKTASRNAGRCQRNSGSLRERHSGPERRATLRDGRQFIEDELRRLD